MNIYGSRDVIGQEPFAYMGLSLIRKNIAPGGPPDPEVRPVCHDSERCEGCPYPRHGFVCSNHGGDCMRSRIEKLYPIQNKGGPESCK